MSAYTRICQIKTRLAQLHARDAEMDEAIQRMQREKAEVATAIEQAEVELEAAVAAPVDGGEDPTSWLPDELMILILLQVVLFEGCGAVSGVCRRWRRLSQDTAVRAAGWHGKWRLYAEGKLKPRVLRGYGAIHALASSPDGSRIYGGSSDETIKVWSGTDGTLLRSLECSNRITSVAIGPDGTLCAGSYDGRVQVWYGFRHTERLVLVHGANYTYPRVAVCATGRIHACSGCDVLAFP